MLNSTITVFPELVFSKRIKSNSMKQVKMAIKIHVLCTCMAIKFSTSIPQSKKSMQIGDKNSVIGGNVFPLIINSAIKINVPDKKIMVKNQFPI